jgi:integral membrane protein (TIGR01906 family)
VNRPNVQLVASIVTIVATPFVVIAAAVVLFLNPFWVSFDQDRSDVGRLTGYTPAQVQQVTGSILADLVFGPPDFDVQVDGRNVLDDRERSHMADVRSVLLELGLAAAIALICLLVVGFASRGASWFWLAVSRGGIALVGGVIVVGGAFAVFFEQAFELFHEAFFSAGSYSFDMRDEKLVQLFPDQFWSETSVGIALAVFVLGVAVIWGSRRLVGEEMIAS